jgi:hypothetical protein
MKKNRVIIFILALAISVCLWAQKGPKDPFQFGKLNQIKMPEVKQFTLKNGLKLFLVEDRSLPTIDMRGMIYTGSVYEPVEKAGLAAITGEVLRSGGTEKLNGDQIDRELETMAASIETGIQDEYGQGIGADGRHPAPSRFRPGKDRFGENHPADGHFPAQ